MNSNEGMHRAMAVAFLTVMCVVHTIAQETPKAPPGESEIARSQSATENETTGWAEIVVRTRPAVVVIETDRGLASGFVIKSVGTIVTNAHVVADAKAMAVKFPSGEVYRSVYLLSSDPIEDLAFLKIEGVELPTISLGNSNDVRVGEPVLLVGAPKGLEQTVSDGLISGIRFEEGVRVLQTSAAASPGSSGGPLLNRRGEAIGVMSFKVVNGENLNFTIPINYVRGKLDAIALSNSKVFGPLKNQDEKHPGVWVAGYGSSEFPVVYMGILDMLGTKGVEVANSRTHGLTRLNENGYMPLSGLLENLSKTGANSLLYVKVESATSLGLPTATVTLQCFDATGRLLWDEKASDVLANGENTIFHPNGWKRRLARHIGKPGMLLTQGQENSSPEAKN